MPLSTLRTATAAVGISAAAVSYDAPRQAADASTTTNGGTTR
ncbi:MULTISPECIES: hypothetical protein [Streptomyces]|nr:MULTISPECIES: hypothetical protein [Streptomyces]